MKLKHMKELWNSKEVDLICATAIICEIEYARDDDRWMRHCFYWLTVHHTVYHVPGGSMCVFIARIYCICCIRSLLFAIPIACWRSNGCQRHDALNGQLCKIVFYGIASGKAIADVRHSSSHSSSFTWWAVIFQFFVSFDLAWILWPKKMQKYYRTLNQNAKRNTYDFHNRTVFRWFDFELTRGFVLSLFFIKLQFLYDYLNSLTIFLSLNFAHFFCFLFVFSESNQMIVQITQTNIWPNECLMWVLQDAILNKFPKIDILCLNMEKVNEMSNWWGKIKNFFSMQSKEKWQRKKHCQTKTVCFYIISIDWLELCRLPF